jgi:hypothetical protein
MRVFAQALLAGGPVMIIPTMVVRVVVIAMLVGVVLFTHVIDLRC